MRFGDKPASAGGAGDCHRGVGHSLRWTRIMTWKGPQGPVAAPLVCSTWRPGRRSAPTPGVAACSAARRARRARRSARRSALGGKSARDWATPATRRIPRPTNPRYMLLRPPWGDKVPDLDPDPAPENNPPPLQVSPRGRANLATVAIGRPLDPPVEQPIMTLVTAVPAALTALSALSILVAGVACHALRNAHRAQRRAERRAEHAETCADAYRRSAAAMSARLDGTERQLRLARLDAANLRRSSTTRP